MKTPSGIRKLFFFALAVATGAVVISCTTTTAGPDKVRESIKNGSPLVEFQPGGGVLVTRVVNLSAHDLARFNNALSTFNNSLYQVRRYDHGRPSPVEGTAVCVTASEIDVIDRAAAKSGTSNVAIQASVNYEGSKPGVERPWGGGGPTCSSANNRALDAQRLSTKVRAILNKYRNR